MLLDVIDNSDLNELVLPYLGDNTDFDLMAGGNISGTVASTDGMIILSIKVLLITGGGSRNTTSCLNWCPIERQR